MDPLGYICVSILVIICYRRNDITCMLISEDFPARHLNKHQALAVLYLYAASTGGHPGALMAMGYRHLHGYGVPQAVGPGCYGGFNRAHRGAPIAGEFIMENPKQKWMT